MKPGWIMIPGFMTSLLPWKHKWVLFLSLPIIHLIPIFTEPNGCCLKRHDKMDNHLVMHSYCSTGCFYSYLYRHRWSCVWGDNCQRTCNYMAPLEKQKQVVCKETKIYSGCDVTQWFQQRGKVSARVNLVTIWRQKHCENTCSVTH